MHRFVAVLLFAALFSPVAKSEIFAGLDVGAGDLDIDNISVAPDFDIISSSDSVTTYHVTAGYEFESGFRVVVGFEEVESIEFLGIGDSIDLEAFKFGAGFWMTDSNPFRVGGTIGIASWDLEARESILFNPGPEATGGLDDTDIYYELGIEWVISETFRMPLTFTYNDYDFGEATIWRIGLRVHFQ